MRTSGRSATAYKSTESATLLHCHPDHDIASNVPPYDSAELGLLTPIGGLSDAEKALLSEALWALRRERGQAWNAACDAAEAQGRRPPSLRTFGIRDIERLARRFGVRAPHWMDE